MGGQSELFPVESPAAPKPPWLLLTRAELASRWRVSPRTVSRLVSDGLPVALRGGGGHPDRFDPEQADAWRAEREASRQTAQGSTGVVSLEHARIRKELSIAEKNEMEIRRRRRELIEVSAVSENWVADSVAIRQRLRAIPRAIAPQLVIAAAAGAKAVRALLAREIDGVLEGLASGDGNGSGRHD